MTEPHTTPTRGRVISHFLHRFARVSVLFHAISHSFALVSRRFRGYFRKFRGQFRGFRNGFAQFRTRTLTTFREFRGNFALFHKRFSLTDGANRAAHSRVLRACEQPLQRGLS